MLSVYPGGCVCCMLSVYPGGCVCCLCIQVDV